MTVRRAVAVLATRARQTLPLLGVQAKRARRDVLNRCVWALSVCLVAACGHKTAVYPPEFVAPQAIEDLRLTASDNGIELRWGRPETYADGRSMDDLGGFVVLRAAQPKDGSLGEFSPLVTIPLEDRDRFRQTRRFRFTDEQLRAGTRYQYRIQAFTLDGDYSIPSNMVQYVWQAGS